MSRVGVIRSLLSAVLFGASAPAASSLAGSIPVFTLAGLLYLGAALAVVPVVIRRRPARAAIVAEWRLLTVAVVSGGAIGPVLLVTGLARTDAASASILLNAELAATVVLAAVVFREHLGGRLVISAVLVTTAGALLAWSPGGSLDLGAVFILFACVAWGLDNGVTARIEQLSAEQVVAFKGVIAGGANLAIGVVVAGLGDTTGVADVAAALLIGAGGYGLSLTLWVKGARDLGAARSQVIFATAPFIGAVLAWTVLDESVQRIQVMAMVLAAVGVGVSLQSGHEHRHRHLAVAHDHEHVHDDGHHGHSHPDGFVGRHSHSHRHDVSVHVHPHVPDLQHRHSH